MSSMTQARMEVEQLRREAAIKRIPVSQVVEDIKVSKTVIDITGEKITRFCREGGNAKMLASKLNVSIS